MLLYIILVIILFILYHNSTTETFHQVEYDCKSDKPECYKCQKYQGCIGGYYEGLHLDKCKQFCKDGNVTKEWYSSHLHFSPTGKKLETNLPGYNLTSFHEYL
jgi:hypothetical protein